MLLPLRPGELPRLIPAVATGPQFNACTGNPRKVLQRVLISVIGAVIALLISQTLLFSSQFGPVFLVVGFVFALYLLWGPILEAGQKNSTLRRYPAAALFEGQIVDLYTREIVEERREQANNDGRLELVENRRTWLTLELEDEEGYLGKVRFPFEKKTPADSCRHGGAGVGAERAQGFFSNRGDQRRLAAPAQALGW